jgi:hypothetical protein
LSIDVLEFERFDEADVRVVLGFIVVFLE